MYIPRKRSGKRTILRRFGPGQTPPSLFSALFRLWKFLERENKKAQEEFRSTYLFFKRGKNIIVV